MQLKKQSFKMVEKIKINYKTEKYNTKKIKSTFSARNGHRSALLCTGSSSKSRFFSDSLANPT